MIVASGFPLRFGVEETTGGPAHHDQGQIPGSSLRAEVDDETALAKNMLEPIIAPRPRHPWGGAWGGFKCEKPAGPFEFCGLLWCERGELNPQELALTGT